MKRTALCCCLLAAIVVPTMVSSQPPTVQFVEPDAETVAVELLAEPASYDRPSSDAFTELEAVGQCSRTKPRGIEVTLGWEVTRSPIEAHRIDITMFRDGFAKGRYVTSGERPAAERQLIFDAAGAGGYYYWRLLTKTPQGWVVSGTGRFEAPICPFDEAPE